MPPVFRTTGTNLDAALSFILTANGLGYAIVVLAPDVARAMTEYLPRPPYVSIDIRVSDYMIPGSVLALDRDALNIYGACDSFPTMAELSRG